MDQGSLNGSYLNESRIIRPTRLKHGDIIRLGSFEIRFETDAKVATETRSHGNPGSTLPDFRKSDAWLLVADIIGAATKAKTLTPEEVAQMNGTWFRSIREVLEAHQGHFNQYLGDGLLGYWEQKAGAARQVTVFLRQVAIRQREIAAGQCMAEPAFRVVMHFGTIGLGAVPTLTSLNLHGAEVNFAFRMEKLAAKLGEPLLLSKAALVALDLPAKVWHEAELPSFDGKLAFAVPELGV